jgi:hypothetical protein
VLIFFKSSFEKSAAEQPPANTTRIDEQTKRNIMKRFADTITITLSIHFSDETKNSVNAAYVSAARQMSDAAIPKARNIFSPPLKYARKDTKITAMQRTNSTAASQSGIVDHLLRQSLEKVFQRVRAVLRKTKRGGGQQKNKMF